MGNRFCGGREGDGDTGEGGVVAGVGGGGKKGEGGDGTCVVEIGVSV